MFLRTEKKRKRKSTIFPELLKERKRNETKEGKEGIICSCEQKEKERKRETVPFFQPMFPEQETFEGTETKRKRERNVSSRIICSWEERKREREKVPFFQPVFPERETFEGTETKRKKGKEGKKRGEGKKGRERGEEDRRRIFIESGFGGNRPVTTQISPIRIPGTATREYPQAE